MDGRKDREPEKSLTLQYFLENPALLQPPENDVEGIDFRYFALGLLWLIHNLNLIANRL